MAVALNPKKNHIFINKNFFAGFPNYCLTIRRAVCHTICLAMRHTIRHALWPVRDNKPALAWNPGGNWSAHESRGFVFFTFCYIYFFILCFPFFFFFFFLLLIFFLFLFVFTFIIFFFFVSFSFFSFYLFMFYFYFFFFYYFFFFSLSFSFYFSKDPKISKTRIVRNLLTPSK